MNYFPWAYGFIAGCGVIDIHCGLLMSLLQRNKKNFHQFGVYLSLYINWKM